MLSLSDSHFIQSDSDNVGVQQLQQQIWHPNWNQIRSLIHSRSKIPNSDQTSIECLIHSSNVSDSYQMSQTLTEFYRCLYYTSAPLSCFLGLFIQDYALHCFCIVHWNSAHCHALYCDTRNVESSLPISLYWHRGGHRYPYTTLYRYRPTWY